MRNVQPLDSSPQPSSPVAPDAARIHLQFRIKTEFQEMPGLCVTQTQAQKLWGHDGPACDDALSALVDEGYLRKSMMGYVKA